MFAPMSRVIHRDELMGDLEQRGRGVGIDLHVAERGVERAGFPEGDAEVGFGYSGVVGGENDDESGNGRARKHGSRGRSRIDVAGMRDDDGAKRRGGPWSGSSTRVSEERCDGRPKFGGIARVESTADRRGTDHSPEEGTPGQR